MESIAILDWLSESTNIEIKAKSECSQENVTWIGFQQLNDG